MDLITAAQTGKASHLFPSVQSSVDTNLSLLLFGKERVYKIYRRGVPFFEYLDDPDLRTAFYREDFSWNRSVSPSIYLQLCSVKKKSGQWNHCSEAEADDFYIEMQRMDETRNLTEMMLHGRITAQDLKNVAQHLLRSIKKLKQEKMASLESWVNRGWKEIMQQRLVSLKGFGESAPPSLEQKEHREVMNSFQNFFASHSYFSSIGRDALTVHMDNPSDNILLLEKGVASIDVLLPKEEWRVVEHWFNVGRLGADVSVLAGREAADLLYQEYAAGLPLPPKEILDFYAGTSAWMRAIYFSILQKPQLAARYRQFVLQGIQMDKRG